MKRFSEENNYALRNSEKATKPRIDVDIHGMKVVIPEGMDLEPEELIERKRDWIGKKQQKFDELRYRIPEGKFEEGAKFPFKGKQLELGIRGIGESKIEDEKFILSKSNVENGGIKDELERLYRTEARNFIQGTVDEYTEKLSVEYDTLRIKNQKTLWGSCSSKNNLNFNWRLIMAPPDKAEYVIIHELCHLREPNHSPKFWRLLSEFCDNPEEKAQLLYEHSVEWLY